MTRHHKRAARRERQAAKALGTERVLRLIGESAPDALPAKLPSGAVLQPEVKERSKPVATIARWLAQAERYCAPGVLPAVVIFTTGELASDALVVLRLDDFRRAVGLEPAPAQGSLPFSMGER